MKQRLEKALGFLRGEFATLRRIANKRTLITAAVVGGALAASEYYLQSHPEYLPYIQSAQQFTQQVTDGLRDKLNLFKYIF